MIFNLKRAVSLHLFAAAILAVPFFASCDNEDIPDAEVVIKNEEGKVITGDTLPVKIGTGIRTVFSITFHYNGTNKKHPYDIYRQYDDNNPEMLIQGFDEDMFVARKSEDLQGGSGQVNSEGYGQQKYHLRTAFPTKIVHVGSIVKIGARTSEAKGEVWYKVVE